jgi:hypothetical protein
MQRLLFLQHIMLSLRFIIMCAIPDLPEWVATEMAKVEFARREACRRLSSTTASPVPDVTIPPPGLVIGRSVNLCWWATYSLWLDLPVDTKSLSLPYLQDPIWYWPPICASDCHVIYFHKIFKIKILKTFPVSPCLVLKHLESTALQPRSKSSTSHSPLWSIFQMRMTNLHIWKWLTPQSGKGFSPLRVWWYGTALKA